MEVFKAKSMMHCTVVFTFWRLLDLWTVLITICVHFQWTYALQPLHMASGKRNNYHRHQPPIKTSMLKQIAQGPSAWFSEETVGTGGSTADIRPRRITASSGTSRPPTAHAAFRGSMPLPSPTFEQRMRDRVFGKSRQSEPHQSESSGDVRHQRRPSNVRMIETLQEYKTIVGDEPNKVVAVRFYATYCKACQAVAPLFYRLATLYPDAMFIDVPVTENNASLHQGLGVPSLPYAHIYHPMVGLAEEQKLTRNYIQSFKEKLHSYTSGSCPIRYDDDDNYSRDRAIESE